MAQRHPHSEEAKVAVHAHTSSSAADHKHHSPSKLRVALFTVSSSRFRDQKLSDETGETAKELFQKAGHEITHKVIDDHKGMIRFSVLKALWEADFDAAVLMGGTGLSPRDVTIEAISPLLDKVLDGYSEVFRRLSYDSIGSPALMSRAIAGVMDGKIVFCLPGSPDAARLGVELLLKELPHAAFIASSKPSDTNS